MKRSRNLAAFVIAAILATSAVARAADSYGGTFALQGGFAKTAAYASATQIGNDPLRRHLDFWMTKLGSATPLHAYDVDMTQRLHLIIVTSDFRTFMHLHPTLGADGHFTITQTFPSHARYYAFADAT